MIAVLAPRRRCAELDGQRGGEILVAELFLFLGGGVGLEVRDRLGDLVVFAAETARRGGFAAGGEAERDRASTESAEMSGLAL